ncbi:reverse transcriptase domain-containing protein [Tanacetum coccineum]
MTTGGTWGGEGGFDVWGSTDHGLKRSELPSLPFAALKTYCWYGAGIVGYVPVGAGWIRDIRVISDIVCISDRSVYHLSFYCGYVQMLYLCDVIMVVLWEWGVKIGWVESVIIFGWLVGVWWLVVFVGWGSHTQTKQCVITDGVDLVPIECWGEWGDEVGDVCGVVGGGDRVKRLCPNNVMRRCIAGNKILEILAHCHSGLTGGHHSASITGRKVYESRFFWPSIFKDAKDYIMRCDAC